MNSTAFFDPSYIVSGLVYIFPYLKVTLGLTVSSVCLGTFWALFCAFLEIRRVPLFKELAALYVLICRSLPNMVLLYLVYYGLPIFVMAMDQEGVFHFPVEKVTALQVAVVGLTLHTGAYLTEIFRAAYEAVPEGQKEAGLVLGMTKHQIFFKITLLQMIKRIVPPMSNEIITLVKDTSLARIIALQEIIWAGQAFMKGSHGISGAIWPLFFTAVYYLIFNGILTVLLGRLEKKLEYFR